MNEILKQLYLISQIIHGYILKSKNLVEIFDNRHQIFFSELNKLQKNIDNNYNFLKENKEYLSFVKNINLIFDMYYLDQNDENIKMVLIKSIQDLEEYWSDLQKIINQLESIQNKLKKMKIL